MKKRNKNLRTPARKLSKQELENGVLAGGCCVQGCTGCDDIGIIQPPIFKDPGIILP